MTEEQILAIAKSKGIFRVSYRWRDDKDRARCMNLVNQGKLFVMPNWMAAKKVGDPRGAIYFAPVKAP